MKQRTSTRQVKVSKAFQVVDEDTRRSNQEQRLIALEQDNYNEHEALGLSNADDDVYQDSEDEEGGRKKKRAKSSSTRVKGIRSNWANRPIKPLDRLLLDNGISAEVVPSDSVNYYTIAAQPPRIPVSHPFCSVCGYLGNYSCTRCGSRYCCIRCNQSHSETRCLKFSI